MNKNKIPSNKVTKPKKKKNKKEIPLSKTNNTNNLFFNKKSDKTKSFTKQNSQKNRNKKNKAKIPNNTNNNYKPDTDYELNWLSYEEALKFDKRSSCEYYSSLLSSKQLFIFTFCSFDDYN